MNWYKISQLNHGMSDEEFKQDWANRNGVETLSDGLWVLYHGTTSDIVDKIRESGYFKEGTYFDIDPRYPEHKSTEKEGEPVIMKVAVDPSKVTCGIWCVANEDIPVIEI